MVAAPGGIQIRRGGRSRRPAPHALATAKFAQIGKYASESACATGCRSRPPERIGTAPGAQVVYGSQITRFQPQKGIVHTCARLFTADLHTSHIWQYMCL